MGSNNTRSGRSALAERQARALELASDRANRSHEEQITLLDQRFGEGLGATRERARLTQLIADRDHKAANGGKGKKSLPKSRGDRRKAKAKRNEERERSQKNEST